MFGSDVAEPVIAAPGTPGMDQTADGVELTHERAEPAVSPAHLGYFR